MQTMEAQRPTAESDASVVAQTLHEKEHFAVLIERYEEKLARYIARLGVGRSEDVADILQDTFLKAYQNLNGYDQALPFSSWIYRIAHNEAVSFFRRRRARPEGNLVQDGEELLRELEDDADTSDEANRSLNSAALGKALETLSPRSRDVIILRFFEERDYSEISDILEIPIGSVATLLHRAKKELRTKLSYLNA